MTSKSLFLVGAALLTTAYMAYVLIRVLRYHGFTSKQKLLQCGFVLLVPLFGAMVVHAVLRTDDEEPPKPDRNFERQDTGAA
jgi:hypothetical protein